MRWNVATQLSSSPLARFCAMIRKLIQRWQIRRTFSQFVPKKAMDDILSGKVEENELRKLKETQLEFVFVAVRGSSAQQISERMGIVADLAVQHKGVVDSLISSLVIVVFGMFPSDTKKSRFALVNALQEKFGSEIKIIHGSEKGHYGYMGNKNRSTYSFIIPNFLEAIRQLASANFGEVKEISKAG